VFACLSQAHLRHPLDLASASKRLLRRRPFLSDHGGPTASAVPTNGRLGGKEPRGKRAIQSPFLNRSEASRKAATNSAYASQKALRNGLPAGKGAESPEVCRDTGRFARPDAEWILLTVLPLPFALLTIAGRRNELAATPTRIEISEIEIETCLRGFKKQAKEGALRG
jgi:hypothetical protein